MNREIILLDSACAVVEDGRLTEYVPVEENDSGDWILGRVERLMPALGSAFIDIGREKAGFLPLKESSLSFRGSRLRSGDRVAVQIRQKENGSKGAALSRDLTMAGISVILMPLNRYIGVSGRIRDEETRERLRMIGEEAARGRFGLVLRSAAEQEQKEAILGEAEALYSDWQKLEQGLTDGVCPRVIRHAPGAAEQIQAFYGSRGVSRVLRSESLGPDLTRQLRQSEQRRVMLQHGGNIVIDPCEALTAIDVNSASSNTASGRRELLLQTNLEACREIAVQTRLRNLGGILMIDMINMETEEDRQKVLAALEEAFMEDRMKTVVHGWTRLGLVEMTRKRS